MPLYEYHCKPCNRLFESFRSVASRGNPPPCPDCSDASQVFLVMTGFARIDIHSRWRPASPVEQLAGRGVAGPGVAMLGKPSRVQRESILHACSGSSCTYCN